MKQPCMQVFFKAGDGYSDVFGVAWPLREDTKQVNLHPISLTRLDPCVTSSTPAQHEGPMRAAFAQRATLVNCLTSFVSSAQRSAEDVEVARARAAKDLVNIDSDERRRRVIFGSILTVGSPRYGYASS